MEKEEDEKAQEKAQGRPQEMIVNGSPYLNAMLMGIKQTDGVAVIRSRVPCTISRIGRGVGEGVADRGLRRCRLLRLRAWPWVDNAALIYRILLRNVHEKKRQLANGWSCCWPNLCSPKAAIIDENSKIRNWRIYPFCWSVNRPKVLVS